MSGIEKIIQQILIKAGIQFEQEKTFTDLKKGKYRYDFYIKDWNGRSVILEAHGIQHYEWVKKFYPTERLWRAALERDRVKISYALSQGFDMYIIPYWDQIKLRSAADLIQPQYKAHTRWHTDEVRMKIFPLMKQNTINHTT